MDLTNEQRALVEPLIIRPPCRADGKGRLRQDDRSLLDGMLWLVRMDAPRPELPNRYPPYQSVYHHLQEWVDSGTGERILTGLADDLLIHG